VIVLLVVGVGVAIAKPWGGPAEPAPPSALPQAVVASPTSSPPTIAPQVPSAAPQTPSAAPPASVGPLFDAFTTLLY
jgi:hypothetical protein